jgi:hypothetical protein
MKGLRSIFLCSMNNEKKGGDNRPFFAMIMLLLLFLRLP